MEDIVPMLYGINRLKLTSISLLRRASSFVILLIFPVPSCWLTHLTISSKVFLLSSTATRYLTLGLLSAMFCITLKHPKVMITVMFISKKNKKTILYIYKNITIFIPVYAVCSLYV